MNESTDSNGDLQSNKRATSLDETEAMSLKRRRVEDPDLSLSVGDILGKPSSSSDSSLGGDFPAKGKTSHPDTIKLPSDPTGSNVQGTGSTAALPPGDVEGGTGSGLSLNMLMKGKMQQQQHIEQTIQLGVAVGASNLRGVIPAISTAEALDRAGEGVGSASGSLSNDNDSQLQPQTTQQHDERHTQSTNDEPSRGSAVPVDQPSIAEEAVQLPAGAKDVDSGGSTHQHRKEEQLPPAPGDSAAASPLPDVKPQEDAGVRESRQGGENLASDEDDSSVVASAQQSVASKERTDSMNEKSQSPVPARKPNASEEVVRDQQASPLDNDGTLVEPKTNQEPDTDLSETQKSVATDPSENLQEPHAVSLASASVQQPPRASEADPASSPVAAAAAGGEATLAVSDKVPMTFPQKLMNLLSREEVRTAMWWLPDGDAFCLAPKVFSEQVLNRFFQGTKFESFTRKLNRWGFKRMAGQKVPLNTVAYHHIYFQKERPELLDNMIGGTKKKAAVVGETPLPRHMQRDLERTALTLPVDAFYQGHDASQPGMRSGMRDTQGRVGRPELSLRQQMLHQQQQLLQLQHHQQQPNLMGPYQQPHRQPPPRQGVYDHDYRLQAYLAPDDFELERQAQFLASEELAANQQREALRRMQRATMDPYSAAGGSGNSVSNVGTGGMIPNLSSSTSTVRGGIMAPASPGTMNPSHMSQRMQFPDAQDAEQERLLQMCMLDQQQQGYSLQQQQQQQGFPQSHQQQSYRSHHQLQQQQQQQVQDQFQQHLLQQQQQQQQHQHYPSHPSQPPHHPNRRHM